MTIRIGILQTAGTPGDLSANLRELRSAAQASRDAGAGLLITPELFVTGYDIGDQVRDLAAAPLLPQLQAIAQDAGIALIAGAPELAGPDLYNSCHLIDANGSLRATYRKSHLFGELDRRYFTAGPAPFALVEFGGLKIAMMICYDVEFPENVRAAALAGAELIAVPTAQMEPFAFVAEQLIRVRAWENQVYVAYCNHIGTEGSMTYVGRSSIVAPSAQVLACAAEEPALLFADIDPAQVAAAQQANPYLADLRRDLHAGARPVTG